MVRGYSESAALLSEFNPFPGLKEIHLATRDNILAVSAGMGGSPHVRVFQVGNRSLSQLVSFYAYAPGFVGGVHLAISSAGIWTGAGEGGGPHVELFDLHGVKVKEFFAGPLDARDGVEVAISGNELTTAPIYNSKVSKNNLFIDFVSITDPDRVRTITQLVSRLYAPYDVNVTNMRPDAPLNQIVHVIVSHVPIQGQANAAGVAVVDGYLAQNQLETHPASVYDDPTAFEGDILLAREIAHEAGHLFGLTHVSDVSSVMYPVALAGLGRWDAMSDQLLGLRLGRA